MNNHDCTKGIEISQPLEQRAALDMYFTHLDNGHLPYLVEQDDGTYIVHCGERIKIA